MFTCAVECTWPGTLCPESPHTIAVGEQLPTYQRLELTGRESCVDRRFIVHKEAQMHKDERFVDLRLAYAAQFFEDLVVG